MKANRITEGVVAADRRQNIDAQVIDNLLDMTGVIRGALIIDRLPETGALQEVRNVFFLYPLWSGPGLSRYCPAAWSIKKVTRG